MKREELIALYAEGQRDFAGVNLRWLNLRHADLSGADLSDADLYNAKLRWADLTGAYLIGANLTNADLVGADLSKADLREVNLSGANLVDANLSGASLRGADLANVQVLFEAPSRVGLLACLKKHAASHVFIQEEWCHCLAGAAAKFVGLPDNSGMGVIAIHMAIPEFNLDVLHQADASVAIAELNKF